MTGQVGLLEYVAEDPGLRLAGMVTAAWPVTIEEMADAVAAGRVERYGER